MARDLKMCFPPPRESLARAPPPHMGCACKLFAFPRDCNNHDPKARVTTRALLSVENRRSTCFIYRKVLVEARRFQLFVAKAIGNFLPVNHLCKLH